MNKSLSRKFYLKLLVALTVAIVILVLFFNVFYFSNYYGFVQVNFINSLFLVPVITLILALGFILGKSKKEEYKLEPKNSGLTNREMEIVNLIGKGKKNTEIAEELFVELSTIKSHVNKIYKKLNVNNRQELIIYIKTSLLKN